MSYSSLKNNLRHIFLVLKFLAKNTSQGTENTQLPLLRNFKCSIQFLEKLERSPVLVSFVIAGKVYFYRTYRNVLRDRPVL